MQILLKLADGVPPASDPDAVALWALDEATSQYNEQSHDDEAYLTWDDAQPAAEAMSLLDGRTDPESVRKVAAGWNARIDADFAHAMAALVVAAPDAVGREPVRYTETVDRSKIYDMKKAAMALDDSFYCFGEYALLVNGEGYFTTVLRPDELDGVLSHPEKYLVIEAYAK